MLQLLRNKHWRIIPSFLVILGFPITNFFQVKNKETPPIFSICGQYPTSLNLSRDIASDNVSKIYLVDSESKLIAVNAKAKGLTKEWQTDLGGETISNIVSDKDNVYIATQIITSPRNKDNDNISETKTIVYSFDSQTGLNKWQKEIDSYGEIYLNTFENLLIIANNTGRILAVSKFSGKNVWEQDYNSEVSAIPYKFRGTLAIGFTSNKIAFINLSSGQPTRFLELNQNPRLIGADPDGKNIYVADDKGYLQSFNLSETKQNWNFKLGARITSIFSNDEGILISSFDNFIYLLNRKNGDLKWKRRLPGRIASRPLKDENFIIAAAFEDSSAMVFDSTNGKLLNSINIEKSNFFAGTVIRLNNGLLIFPTKNGIVGVSNETCKNLTP